MAGDWRTFTIDQIKANDERAIAIGPFGSRMKTDVYVECGVPVIRGNNISETRAFSGNFAFVSDETADDLRSCNVFADDLVFPHRGAIGEVGIVPKDAHDRYMLSTSLMKLTCNREVVEPLFVFYFFRSSLGRNALLRHASTVGTPGIGQPLTSLRSITLSVPPLREQRAIAHILGTLDDKIELNRRMNETLEAMARAIFKDWFVDFGPVRAKMEGRAPYIASEVWSLFPERLDAEGKPEGWRSSMLGDFFRLERGLSYKGEFLDDEVGLPMINLGCFLGEGRFNRDKIKGYRGEFRPRHTVTAGTLLLANTDMTQNRVILGSPHIAETGDSAHPCLFSHHIYAARPMTDGADQWTLYFYFHLLQPEFRERAEGFATGTTVLALPSDAVERCSFVMPPHNLHRAFMAVVTPLLERRRRNETESRVLAAARDALLPKLIAGAIRVKDAEKLVEAVA